MNNFPGHCGLLSSIMYGILFGHDCYVFLYIAVFSYTGFSFVLFNSLLPIFQRDPYVWCIPLVNFSIL